MADVVKHRIGKYEQPEHPNRISHEEASSIFRKIRREIIAKEHEAYAERQKQDLYKPILVRTPPPPPPPRVIRDTHTHSPHRPHPALF